MVSKVRKRKIGNEKGNRNDKIENDHHKDPIVDGIDNGIETEKREDDPIRWWIRHGLGE